MKKAFLSISFKNRKNLQDAIESIRYVLSQHDYKLHIFVDEYSFDSGEEQKMMKLACDEIKSCDLIIAEVSDKAIGVGIEIGYAIACNKPVIYLRNNNAEYSSTVGGMVKTHVIYSNKDDLKSLLEDTFKLSHQW